MIRKLVPGAMLALAACATADPAPVHRTPEADAANSAEQAADEKADFQRWVAAFRADAAAAGVEPDTLAAAFDPVAYQPRVIELDRAQPEFTRQIWEYLDTAVSGLRIRNGRDKLERHPQAAEDAARNYGVPAEILVAIWGLESNYGSNLGGFETIDALATLGYEGRRRAFARRQLMAALEILASGDVARERMQGSWAGAMGQTQFLPTSYLARAVDADGDGQRDIWGSVPDVLASIAHYLDQAGWRSGQPWGAEVVLPEGFDYAQAELDVRKSSRDWRTLGVAPARGESLPAFDAASVITPAGAHGPAFLVGPNFRAIMAYNAATSYALAVAHLADRIAGGPAFAGEWPRGFSALSRDQIETLQRQLNAHGFDAGAPDGRMGPNTRRALRAYQRSQGLVPDGYPTFALLQQIRGTP